MQRPRTSWVRRFEVAVSILTASVTILSAIIAWRAALASDSAGNADFAGIGASLNREESRILNSAIAFEQYRAYTTYLRNNEIGNAIASDLGDETKQIDEAQRDALAIQRTASWNQTLVDNLFFSTRHLSRDGAYDVERQLGELAAEEAKRRDIDPQPHFALADRLRAKSNLLVGMLIIMAGALWFYTLAGEIKHPLRYLLAALGTICMLVAMLGTLAIEVL